MQPSHAEPGPSLADKVAQLSRPETYAEGTTTVETIETHMSYAFLTDRYVYKLKKPVRHAFLDFSTLDARRFNCLEELRLNRRLARDVYLDVVPLTFAGGRIAVQGSGEVVDWLVKMRRLPRELMLDRTIVDGRLDEEAVVRVAHSLAAFYRRAERTGVTAAAYRDRLCHSIDENGRALADPRYGVAPEMLGAVIQSLTGFLGQRAALFEPRARKIVEGHGDLRPEHVCLTPEPIFIDCLEFNRALRIVDPADELAYLSMECELLGAKSVRDTLFTAYQAYSGDAVPLDLVDFYASSRALTRAKLAAWHLDDQLTPTARARWLARTADYMRLAARGTENSSTPR